jgi:hypothetical protein
VFRTKNIIKRLETVPKDIRFYIIMMKTAYSVVKESQESKHFSENSKKRSGLSTLVHHVTDPLWRLIKRKRI